MKKSTLASAIILMAIATSTVAQPLSGYGPGPGPGGCGMMSGAPCMGSGGPGPGGGGGLAGIDFRVQRMTQMLGLSPQQQGQVRDILEEQQNSRYATRAQVDAILTPEQRALHAQMMRRGGSRGYGGGYNRQGW
ncbi:MAG: hypothetical protein IPN92_05355 [Chromatiaceae bacterium]|nr:hypothetical protein [Chromatiaceae bacterium]